LLEIVRRERIQLLVPIVDYEFPKLSEHRDEFERLGCRVVISSPHTISICNEKERTHSFFQEIGIASPRTWLPTDLPSPTTISYPIFVKPRAGRASLGIHKIRDAEEFAFWSERVEDPLYQEFVDGDEYTIDVLCDFDGRVIGVVPRQRIEMKVGISYKGLTVRDPEMINAGKFIAEKAGIIGPANIQCFKTRRGLVFFEINPRFSGTLPLTIAAGLNGPLLLAKSASGCKIETSVGNFQEGLLMLRFWDELFITPSGTARRGFVAVPETRAPGEKS
jgi:carbamoyl-phosphate synthase large subunit